MGVIEKRERERVRERERECVCTCEREIKETKTEGVWRDDAVTTSKLLLRYCGMAPMQWMVPFSSGGSIWNGWYGAVVPVVLPPKPAAPKPGDVKLAGANEVPAVMG